MQDSDPDEFEFGCVTKPGPPNSPADHLFFNGKLLPHVFPLNRPANNFSYSRSTSSKDSLMSSCSNSTDSRSSSCSSARTSTSEASERKILSTRGKVPGKKPVLNPQYNYCSSQRWQFIRPSPVLMHQVQDQDQDQ
ncbi:unnamed protein product [Fraxinus pennsylvanica]|uniref:Uncharacterized protein n=1 Tax=Fraxinus pennsylvanica TaxID=56036 RepID=A0AAD2AFQ2_9LAMI|nr:unnamed protein product [Fraxinus pennsylvanica]